MTAEKHDPFVRLNLAELRALAALDPTKLLNWIGDSGSRYLFGIEDLGDDAERWGGRYRLTINRNIEVHFVPGLNSAMTSLAELPRWSILPDPKEAGRTRVLEPEERQVDPEEPGESGLIIYVAPEDFAEYSRELAELVTGWSADPYDPRCAMTFPFLPESYFRAYECLDLINERVLSHALVEGERKFDGRLGYPLTPQEDDDLNADMPPPEITDDAEEARFHAQMDAELGLDKIDEEEDDDPDERWREEQRRREGY